MRRSGHCLNHEGAASVDTAETKKQFANAIAQNQKAQRDKMIKTYKKIQ